jgi:hypothetical protein
MLATVYGLYGRNRSSSPVKGKIVSAHVTQTGSGAHPAFYLMDIGGGGAFLLG